MSDTLEPLIRDLVQWCACEPRGYLEVLDAWRTSCPRLMVWETAVERGLLVTEPSAHGLQVRVSARGLGLLRATGAATRAAVRPPAVAIPTGSHPA